MTRQDFLKTMAGAGALATLSGSEVASAAPQHSIRRGVSLYSYQEEYYTRAMTLQDCLSEASSIGARAIEILPEEMVPNFPNPSDEWVDRWHGWMDRYHLVPNTYCQFQDTVLIKGRDQSLDDGVAMLERDLKLARRMGLKNMRLLIGTPIDVIERGIPLAEHYDVWMGCEIHAPATVNSRLVHRWLEVIEKHKTQHFGLIPDFGIFQQRPPRVARDRQIRDGQVTERIAKYIEQACESGTAKEAAAAEVAKMNPKPGDTRYLATVYNTRMEDPKQLVPLKPYIHHFHAKFYEMTDEYHEFSIPYE